MDGSKESSTHLSYTTSFVGLLVFSALATEVFLAYLLVRGRSITDAEALIVGWAMWTFFSALGQRFTKIQYSRKWIFSISAIASFTYYRIFIVQAIVSHYVLLEVFAMLWVVLMFGFIAWWEVLDSSMKSLQQRKIPKKTALTFGGAFLGVVLFGYIVYSYHQTIVSFFDIHPWVIGLIGIFVSTIVGVFIGRRTKD